jgi:hypothetical protein
MFHGLNLLLILHVLPIGAISGQDWVLFIRSRRFWPVDIAADEAPVRKGNRDVLFKEV